MTPPSSVTTATPLPCDDWPTATQCSVVEQDTAARDRMAVGIAWGTHLPPAVVVRTTMPTREVLPTAQQSLMLGQDTLSSWEIPWRGAIDAGATSGAQVIPPLLVASIPGPPPVV
jgi:hypothetical protein